MANTTVASRVAVIGAHVVIAKDHWRCAVAEQLCPPAGSCVALLGISGQPNRVRTTGNDMGLGFISGQEEGQLQLAGKVMPVPRSAVGR